MRGRYTPYSPQLAADICALVAEGWNLRRISLRPGMPGRSTLGLWLAERDDFRAMHRAARAQRPKMIRGGPVPPRAPGARRGYSRAKGEAICARIAAGESLNQLVQDRRLPGVAAIYDWLDAHHEFRRMYQAACEVRSDRLVDEATAIADDVAGDVRRDRLRIDIRKWRVGVMEPRRYGRRAPGEAEPVMSHDDWILELEAEEARARDQAVAPADPPS